MNVCPQCGAALRADARAGDCPACLMEAGTAHASVCGDEDVLHPRPDDHGIGFLDPPVEPGTIGVFDTYDVIEQIGAGGAGILLRARDPALKRIVAIKVLAPAIATSREARGRFRREAQAAAAVRHPHIVVIHSVGEWKQLPYLVMDMIEGESLAERLQASGPLPVDAVVRFGGQMASALAAAHAAGLIHRDVKPGNILIASATGTEAGKERVKVADFGLARASDDPELTLAGAVWGTPGYMSPEQARGDRNLDARSDLFSLGCVLYAMVTGHAPFRGGSTLEVLRKVVDEMPTDPRAGRELPGWLTGLILRLLSKDPAGRPASAAEVATMFRRESGPLPRDRPPRRWLFAAAAVPVSLLAGWILWPEGNAGAQDGDPPLGRLSGSWGWRDLGPEEIVQVSEDNGRTFFVAPVNSEVEWRRFLELLPEADKSSLQVFAAVSGPWLPSHVPVRWFSEMDSMGHRPDPGAPPAPRPLGDQYAAGGLERWTDQRRCTTEWLEAWCRAAKTLSRLSTEHRSLAGLVIDSFDVTVEGADQPHQMDGRRLTIDEVERLHAAAHSHNPRFGLYPNIPYAEFGSNLAPGFVLGVNYGAQLFPDDRTEVTLKFLLPADPDLSPVLLRFCQCDAVRKGRFPDVEKHILVNGTTVWSRSVALDEFNDALSVGESAGPGTISADLVPMPPPAKARCPGAQGVEIPAGLLQPGHRNTISFTLRNTDDEAANGCGILLWELWNVRVCAVGQDLPVEVSFHTEPHAAPYALLAATCPPNIYEGGQIANWEHRAVTEEAAAQLPDSANAGRGRQRLIATPNDRYLITDFIDGVIVRSE